MEYQYKRIMNIVSFLIGIAILIVVLKILTFPLKLIVKFVINSIIGGIILAICSFMGIGITVYWWTILLTGIFGVAGLLVSILITFFVI